MPENENAYDYVSASTIGVELEKSQINKFHTKGGTGFAAEEANAAADRWAGATVDQVGTSNTRDGADRIVNGQPIQTKYFSSPSATLRSAFDSHGHYRYGDQMLEVPSDQYGNIVEMMRRKIRDGLVPGITDPGQAESIVRKGQVTYRQARNIARPGNIDSLVFDAQTQAVTTGYAFALSFAINFAKAKWDGRSYKEAINDSIVLGIQSGAGSFITGIATSQILRTRAAAFGVVFMRNGVRSVASTSLGKTAIEKIAQVSLGKMVYGAAAANHVAKLLRTNAATGVITTAIVAAPDFYRAAFERSISWAQFGKNLTIGGAGVAGGAGGWMAGAAAGAVLGSAMCPGVGTALGGAVGGVIGSVAIGTAATSASKYALDNLIEDDAKEMLELLPDYLQPLAEDYLLSKAETELLIERLKPRLNAEFLRDMYKSAKRSAFVYDEFEPLCVKIAAHRPLVAMPEPHDVEAELDVLETSVKDALDEELLECPDSTLKKRKFRTTAGAREWLHREDSDLSFLRYLQSDELDALVCILTREHDDKARRAESLTGHILYRRLYPDHCQYWDLIAAEVQNSGPNSIATLVRLGKGVPYREVLTDVCAKFSIDYDKDGLTEAIESALLAKLVGNFLHEMPADDLVLIAQDLGVEHAQTLRGSGLSSGLLAAFQCGGPFSQRIVLAMLQHFLGRSILFAGSSVITPAFSAWTSPISWAFKGVWGASEVASPADRVTIPAVLQIAALRRQHLMKQRGEIPE